jgi:hypothetical protein
MGPAQIIPTIPTNFETQNTLNFIAVLIYQSFDGDCYVETFI